MSFQCPHCGISGGLQIGAVLDLPADARWDEISLQAIACHACEVRGVAAYQESRRGALDRDDVEHWGFEVRDDVAAEVARAIAACPAPRNPNCRCATHRRLARADASGRIDPLRPFPTRRMFPLQVAPRSARPPVPVRPMRISVHWRTTGDAEVIYRATVGGRTWTVRVNDFPAYPTVYSLLIDGNLACDVDGWPDVWNRPEP